MGNSIVDGVDNASADDFAGGSDTVNIAADSETATFTIDITGDTIPEYDETFTVTLSDPSTGARISQKMVLYKLRLAMMMDLD